jgi:hypothetical protein
MEPLNHERQNQDSLLVVTGLPAALFLASRKNDEIFFAFLRAQYPRRKKDTAIGFAVPGG